MDRQMAPTSQGLDHGGIINSDWFSDRLKNITPSEATPDALLLLLVLLHVSLPVQGVTHLYCNQDGQSHRHGIR